VMVSPGCGGIAAPGVLVTVVMAWLLSWEVM